MSHTPNAPNTREHNATQHNTTQVKTEAQADEILQRLEGGADFGEIAMVESECPSKQQGGDLGWFGSGQMVPEFEQACFENEPGARVKVQTQFGFHIIQVHKNAMHCPHTPSPNHPQWRTKY
jgi:peptidyl-prolyl cis-trans isomerase C